MSIGMLTHAKAGVRGERKGRIHHRVTEDTETTDEEHVIQIIERS
jgi:hypothetical protein